MPPDTTDTVVVELAARIVPIYALYMLTSASMWAIRGNLNGNQNPLLLFPAGPLDHMMVSTAIGRKGPS